MAESHLSDQEIITVSKEHKVWIRNLIAEYLQSFPNAEMLVEVTYTLIEGLISRFLVEGFETKVATEIKDSINQFIDNLSPPKI